MAPDASTASEVTSSVILPGRRRGVATRLEQGVLTMESRAFERRIPVAAIERVEITGAKGRSLVLVLTAPEKAHAESWKVDSRSAPAVRAFADALRLLLPVRDAGEVRTDGALLVTRVPVEKPTIGWRRAALRLLVSLYLLAAAAMLVGGLLGAYEWYAALACWLIGSLAIPIRHGVSAGWDMAREAWRLRTSGVLVEGRKSYYGSYEFTDLDGRIRSLRDSYESEERVRVLYDPADPQQTAQVGHRTAGTLAFGGLVCLLSLAMVIALAAIGLAGPLAALRVLSVDALY
ncbi:hypothetical protein OG275_00550 [Streptomyces niveus]|uniref:hypothetical protein n=1 Tax=Streptomyces niveus TaxID=193462 RepID=UPI002E33EC11|nr:hypothetical protein [Streptomyces niveus]